MQTFITPKTTVLIEAMVEMSELQPHEITLGNPLSPYDPNSSTGASFEACRAGIGLLEDRLTYDPDAANEAGADRLVTARNALSATLYWLTQYSQFEHGRWGKMEATAASRRAATYVLAVTTLLPRDSVIMSSIEDARLEVRKRTLEEQRAFLLAMAEPAKLLLRLGDRIRDPLIERQIASARYILKKT